MTTRTQKIPARKQSSNDYKRPWWKSLTLRNNEDILRCKAWYLQSFLCRETSDENMENMRKVLSVCCAVQTVIKLTPTHLISGKRSRHHRLKQMKIPLDYVMSIEQDELFVNVVLCFFRLDDMPDGIQYEIAAYKFHDIADVRRLVAAFQKLTGSGPVEKTRSMVNGSVLARSVGGGSLHSLGMPGRPTNGSVVPDRWVAVDRTQPRRYMSASMGDLTAGNMSDVFYPSGYQTNGVQRNGGARCRYTPEQQTMTSDEGNGSLTFSDQQRSITCREVDVSINKPFDPQQQPAFRYQRNHPYSQNHTNVSDVGCQAVIPNGLPSSSHTSGVASVITGSRMMRYTELDDDDDVSTVSGMTSSVMTIDDEPGLLNGQYIAVTQTRSRNARRPYNSVGDELDGDYTSRAIPDMSSSVYRVYNKPSYSGSATGYSQDNEFVPRTSRYQSDSNFLQVPAAATRSRSVDPRFVRSTSGARSDIGVSYRTNGGPTVIVDNSDAMSTTSSAREVMQSTALIHPTFEKRYISRDHNTVYRQAPRPSRGSSSSGYGGARTRTISHRIR